MVNRERIMDRLKKGAFVGVGSFSASLIGNLIEDNLNTGDVGTAAGELVVGAGVSVGVDEVFDTPDSLPNDFFEFMGYGVQGAAWADLADTFQTGAGLGSSMVDIQTSSRSSRGSSRQTGQDVSGGQMQQESFSLDV